MKLMDKAEEYLNGKILLFNKPVNWTSFDVVRKVKSKLYHKYKLKKIKVGHAGTLDPLADGLMLVCTGKATKKLNDFQDFGKEYVATIEIGKTTPSFDLETDFDNNFPIGHINRDMIEKCLSGFLGEQEQMPPIFSAKRINGKRAYEMAREKKEVELKPSTINIEELELLDYEKPMLKVKIKCSKGTYIRSFANDLGKKLESGAYLAGLTRTSVGDYSLNGALDIERFEED